LHDAVLLALEAALHGTAGVASTPPTARPHGPHTPQQEVFLLLPEDSVPVKALPVLRERLCGPAYASLQCLRGQSQHDVAVAEPSPTANSNSSSSNSSSNSISDVVPERHTPLEPRASKGPSTPLSWLSSLLNGSGGKQKRRRLLHDVSLSKAPPVAAPLIRKPRARSPRAWIG
jgi:hypothetical protein